MSEYLFETCRHCKYCITSVTYKMSTPGVGYYKNRCKITGKEKTDEDTCGRFKYGNRILAV